SSWAARVAPGQATGIAGSHGGRRSPGGSTFDTGRGFQRLARTGFGFSAAPAGAGRGLHAGWPRIAANFPRPLPALAAGPHLHPQCARGRGARAHRPTVVAFVRSRTAGRQGGAMNRYWRYGNSIRLLENGEEYFP